MLTSVGTWVTRVISTLGYPGLVFIMILENIFPPIPSEVVIPFAGFLVTKDRFNLFLVIISGVLGSVLGAVILYGVGFFFSGGKIRGFLRKYGRFLMVEESDLNKGEEYFNRYGERAVLVARVIPIVRSIISVPAGFIKMPMKKFLTLTVVGTFLWTSFLTFLGVILGESWYIVGPIFKKFDYLVAAIIIFAIAYYILRKLGGVILKERSD